MGVFEYIRNDLRGVFEYDFSEMGKIWRVFRFRQKGVIEYQLFF
jgi:hypothetical protein